MVIVDSKIVHYVRVAKHCIYTCIQRHSIPSDGLDRGDGVDATGAVELTLPIGS